jgi:Ser/Thr protein kinase RdoA (MazF antagonist)
VTIPFEQASYLAQVTRLRALAEQALARYGLRAESCRLLNHVENTTFRVTAKGGKQYCLRIHRNDYHTRPAIMEELRWLQNLSRDAHLIVPKPVPSRSGQLLESVGTDLVGEARNCALLEWIEGRFIDKSLNADHLKSLGQIIGRLHRRARHRNVRERRYWDAEGLLGTKPKLGSVEDLPGISSSNQKTISDARRSTFQKLKQLEHRYSHRRGLIHADLHFGNVLMSKGRMAVIDFDDCGFGFLAYDLAVPLWALQSHIWKNRHKQYAPLKAALLEGYTRESQWDRHDEEILSYLMIARRLVLLGWLHSRSDNPKLRGYFQSNAKSVVKYLHSL